MSDESRLRWHIERANDPSLLAEWDALLAESRAEVERLRAAYAESDRRAARYMQQVADLSRGRDRARAEALEDARALAVRIRDAGAAILKPDAPKDMRDVLAGGNGALNTFIHEVSTLITTPAPASIPVEKLKAALGVTTIGDASHKSTGSETLVRAAPVILVEKVREVLVSDLPDGPLSEMDDVERACAGTIQRIARGLGVGLDADGEAQCSGCDNPAAGPHRFSCAVGGKQQVVLSASLDGGCPCGQDNGEECTAPRPSDVMATEAPEAIPAKKVRDVARETLYGGGEAGDGDLTREEKWFNKGITALLADLGIPLNADEGSSRTGVGAELCACGEPRYKHDKNGRIVETLRGANGTQWGEVVHCHGFHLLVTP